MKKLVSSLAKVLILSFFMMTVVPVVAPVTTADSFASTSTTGSGTTTDDNILVDSMCNVLKIVVGPGGKAFAAFAVISVGIGFFTGKVSWGLMIGVAMGIAAIFGAPSIVAAISGKESFDCS